MPIVTITSISRANPGTDCKHLVIEADLDGRTVSEEIHLREWRNLLKGLDPLETVLIVLAERIHAAGATTPAEIKLACEGQVINLGS